MSIHCLIVDDEEIARQRLRRLLESSPYDLSYEEAANVVEAGEKIQQKKPDLMFLDISMPQYNGFELLQQHSLEGTLVVFQTAYSEYALQAFESNAENYLLKPFTKERFQEVLAKAVRRRGVQVGVDHLRQIAVKLGLTERLIDVDQVQYFESEDRTTYLCLEDRRYTCSYSLKELEQRLSSGQFYRIHRRTIVNAKQIESWTHTYPLQIALRNGAKVFASKEKRHQVKEWLLKNLSNLSPAESE